MAEPLTINVQQFPGPAPAVYTVPGSVEVEALAASASFNGAGASAPFLACMTVYSASGLLIARVFPSQAIAVGGSADVTYAPSLDTGMSQGTTTTPFHLVSAATTNATLVQSGQTQLGGYYLSNINAAARYVKLYDKATAPTVGTDVPKWTLMIPAGAAANVQFPSPMLFVLGLGFGTTTGAADNDSGAVASGDMIVNLAYS